MFSTRPSVSGTGKNSLNLHLTFWNCRSSINISIFENIVFLQVAKIMCLYKNGQLPESFKNMFSLDKKFTTIIPEIVIFIRLPSWRTNVRKFSLRFQGPKIFNSINDEIKNSLSVREFTSKLKSTFLD